MTGIRTITLLGLAAATAAATALALPASADKPGQHDTTKTSTGSQQFVCHDTTGTNDNTVTLNGPLVLWPPNHKMVNESVTAASDPDTLASAGMTSLTLYTADPTDASGGDGSPNEGPDSSLTSTATDSEGDGTVTAPYQVRAERSGKGDGRTYSIRWMASFKDGSSCGSDSSDTDNLKPFVISVPHDQGAK